MRVQVTDVKNGTARVVILGDGDAELVSRVRRLPVGTERVPGEDHDVVLRTAGLDVLREEGYVKCGGWTQSLQDRTWSVVIQPRVSAPDPAP